MGGIIAQALPAYDHRMPSPPRVLPTRDDLGRLFTLAGPVVVAEIGWMSMGLVDTIMVAPLGATAIGSVGLGGILFMGIGIFGMGLLLGLDTFVSQAHGAGDGVECRRWLGHGLSLALILAVPGTLLLAYAARWLPSLGLHPEVLSDTSAYVAVVNWSLLPLVIYSAFRRYLQGMGVVRPIVVALLSANLVNVAANWMLIYGHLGMPRLGVAGAAWATVISRVYLAVVLGTASWLQARTLRVALWRSLGPIEPARLWRLLTLGLPAASQITLEVGVFAAATALAGRLDPVSLASHQIALNVASVVFMVPLGVASASAVLVGQAVGARDGAAAARAGWGALGSMAVFMIAVATVFVSVPHWLVGAFTAEAGVVALASRLLLVAAVFQLFDGLQAVATGALRGVGDTRTPMLLNLAAHWGLGLPVGYVLCFREGWGVVGLWVGLSVGLISVGAALLVVWRRRVRQLRETPDQFRVG